MTSGPAGPPTSLAAGLEALAHRLEHGSGPEVLVAEDLQVHPDALADLTEDPRATTAALVSRLPSTRSDSPGDVRAGAGAGVRLLGGRVVDATAGGSGAAAPGARFTGALRVAAGDRVPAAAAARGAADLARDGAVAGDPLDHLLVALVQAGTPVGAVTLDPWPWRRGPGGADADAFGLELAAIGPDRSHAIRLARATKTDDGAWATLVSRPVSRQLTPLALRLRLSPNQVTVASLVVGLGAAACFATGARAGLVAGAVLLQLSLVVDCVDGDVARYHRSFTATGAWLDASTDRLKEFACYGGLALGAGGGREVWLLAGVMLTVQTVRHSVDYTFTAVKELREVGALPGVLASRAVQASERGNRRAAVKWTKRVLHLGIGERWAVLSVLAALGRPVTALMLLLVLALVSFSFTGAGRTLRTRAWPRQEPSAREREIVTAQLDLGPLPAALAGPVTQRLSGGSSRFLWLRPALVRLTEYAVVLAASWAALDRGATTAAFVVLLVVASHHYDQLYRVLQGLRGSSGTIRALGLGVSGRLLVVLLLAALAAYPAGGDVLEGGLWVLAAGLGILFLVVEPVGVLREARDARAADRRGAAGGHPAAVGDGPAQRRALDG